MSDRRRTGRPTGRPPRPDKLLSVQLTGARFEDAELSKLKRQAQRAGLRLASWCRSVLEGAALSVPELELPLQAKLVRTGHVVNDAVYRLHSNQDVAPIDAIHAVQLAVRAHHRALVEAARLLEEDP